ncbi:MAG: alpha/beta hydrolase [Sandaracinaceae bacterium]|nr:alpha/beta hydrolase [Sandaracinaceae bacterium]
MTPEHPSDPPLRVAWTAHGSFTYTDEGEGPALVLAHGLPGGARDFRWLASALAGRVRAVRLEQPGFGQTPRSTETGTTLAHRARFLLEAADAVGLDRFAVLGHSMGGPVAMALAAAAPARVTALALVASVGLSPHRLARRTERHPDLAWLLTFGPIERLVLPSMRRAFTRVGFPSSTPDGELVQSTRLFSQLSFAEVRAAARGVRAPTLLAWSEDDPLVEPAIGLALCGTLPAGPRLVFADGGHNLQKTRAVELADALVAFLA